MVATLFEDFLHDGKSRKCIRPACVEGNLRQDFGGLTPSQAVVHGAIEVIVDLRHLSRSDERADGHETSVARRQGRPEPQIPEQRFCRVLY
jgi:hypothetical protein